MNNISPFVAPIMRGEVSAVTKILGEDVPIIGFYI